MAFLAVDIGNTNIKTGYFAGGELAGTLESPSTLDPGEYWAGVGRWLGRDRFESIESVGIASVVKGLGARVSEALAGSDRLARARSPRVWILGGDFPFALESAYKPGLLGVDRMLAAIAGVSLFGKPVITVDIGSAVTIDFVDHGGVFRGGLILAGGGFRLKALADFTSLLPEIPVPESPPPLIGTDTEACLGSGVYHGMRAEIEGLVRQIQEEAGRAIPVVMTGKGSRLFHESLPEGWHLEDWLVLKGIYFACPESRRTDEAST